MSPFWLELLWPMAIVAVAYVVLGLAGFGSALIAVPLLALIWPLPQVVALVLLIDAPASALHARVNIGEVDRQDLLRLLPGIAAGAVLGWWLSQRVDARWPLLVLGLYAVVVGVRALRGPGVAPRPASARWAAPVGVLIGTIEMLFATSGPVILDWLRRRQADARTLRATAPVLKLMAMVTVLVSLALVGQLSSPTLWRHWAVLATLALPAVLLGNRLARHVPLALLGRGIYALLVVSGLMLCRRALG